ncbi:MAG: hypothetical protein KGH74_03525 [Candidatus Micrarchaeota archaeon]|nr:hypothetical protein [Candidatus Micrarchaeota archaeon]
MTGISGSQAITSSVTIQEAGLFSKGYAAAGGTMLFHDTFVGINVINGDTVTISYEIDLNNSGLNDNFCRFIAGGMTGNLAGGGASNVTITSTSGSTLVVDLWCNAGSAVGTDVPNKATAHSTSCGTPPSTEPMAIGTGSSAFTTSSLALTTMVGSYTQVASASYVSPTNYWTTTFTVGSSNTIGEAGMFLTISGVNYMFFALTFTGQSETANTPFGVTIRMSD